MRKSSRREAGSEAAAGSMRGGWRRRSSRAGICYRSKRSTNVPRLWLRGWRHRLKISRRWKTCGESTTAGDRNEIWWWSRSYGWRMCSWIHAWKELTSRICRTLRQSTFLLDSFHALFFIMVSSLHGFREHLAQAGLTTKQILPNDAISSPHHILHRAWCLVQYRIAYLMIFSGLRGAVTWSPRWYPAHLVVPVRGEILSTSVRREDGVCRHDWHRSRYSAIDYCGSSGRACCVENWSSTFWKAFCEGQGVELAGRLQSNTYRARWRTSPSRGLIPLKFQKTRIYLSTVLEYTAKKKFIKTYRKYVRFCVQVLSMKASWVKNVDMRTHDPISPLKRRECAGQHGPTTPTPILPRTYSHAANQEDH